MRRTKRGGWPYSQPPNVPFTLNKDSPQAKGLMAWWPTLASRGTHLLRDLSNHAEHGVFPGGGADPVWMIDGEMGAVLDYDGTNDYVDASNIYNTISPFAVTAWIYSHDNANRRGIFTYGDSGAQPRLLLQKDNDNSFKVFVPNLYIDAGTIPQNQWTHIGVSRYSTTTVATFVNGVVVGSTAAAWAGPAQNARLWIGRETFATIDYFDGLIGDVRFYNHALTTAEMYACYAPETRWELYKPLIPWTLAKSPITIRIPRYGFTNYQVPGIV